VTVGVRPDSLSISTVGIPAVATFVEVLGADAHVQCTLNSGEHFVVRQSFDAPRPGPDEPVHIEVNPGGKSLHLFDVKTGVRVDDSA
jgi:hypothetical protein